MAFGKRACVVGQGRGADNGTRTYPSGYATSLAKSLPTEISEGYNVVRQKRNDKIVAISLQRNGSTRHEPYAFFGCP